jgi:hypothetical protein
MGGFMSGIYGIPESFEPQEPDPEPATPRHTRPSKSVVSDRDARVYEVVLSSGFEGISRADVAKSLNLTMHEAYLSLNRVQSSGRIKNTRRNNAHFWVFVPYPDEDGEGA